MDTTTLEHFVIADVDFYSNRVVMNVTDSSSSQLRLNKTYNLFMHIEHSAGRSNTTGGIFIRM